MIAVGGVVATLLATAAWQYGSARVGAASAGVFINIEPMMGAVLGVMLFGDHLTAALVVGGLLAPRSKLDRVRDEADALERPGG